MGQSLNSKVSNSSFLNTSSNDHSKTHRKTFKISVEHTSLSIEILDESLTTGWLLSEVIRRNPSTKSIAALHSARGIEILDAWLGHYDRRLLPFNHNEHLQAVFSESVGSSPSLSDFTPIKVIGKGAFSRVLLVRKKDTGHLYAIKTINKDFVVQEGKESQIIHEKNVLARVHSPFIVNLHWAFQTSRDLHIVLDFCPGGELFFHLQNFGRLSETQARFYFCEILMGLEYLHHFSIVYRDLKPENVLLDIDGHIRITDFGLSKQLSYAKARSFSFCGSPEYMSPEMLRKEGHGREVDFYSLGALLFEMLTGLPPFYHPNRAEMYSNILNEPLIVPEYLSKNARLLLKGLLHKDFKLRLGVFEGVEEIKKQPWLAGIDWKLVKKRAYSPPFKPNLRASNFDPEYTREFVDNTEFLENHIYRPSSSSPFAEWEQLPMERFDDDKKYREPPMMRSKDFNSPSVPLGDFEKPRVPTEEIAYRRVAYAKGSHSKSFRSFRSFRSFKLDQSNFSGDTEEAAAIPTQKVVPRAREAQLV